ncbi:MAG: helix-turn-helix domain-containing protein [Thioalkalivibrio sp.]|nr:helix-turn-helix domain-containing protein [Thioalkalivibrio sp.]
MIWSEEGHGVDAIDRSVITRWGGFPEILSRGFLAVPRNFLWYGPKLTPEGVTPVEAMFILQVMSYKWEGKEPYPGLARIAGQMGVSTVYTRKIAKSLEGKGLLIRTRPAMNTESREFPTTRYDFGPLFSRLARLAREHPRRDGKSYTSEVEDFE